MASSTHIVSVLITVLMVHGSYGMTGPKVRTQENDPNYWNRIAKQSILNRFKIKENNAVAKNVILFIGDGLGPTTVTASRILRGQLNGQPGEETVLTFEKFPNVALSKTYNVDRQTADSAGTATAILSGVKTNYYTVGLNSRAKASDCSTQAGNEVETIMDWVQAIGKKTGIVTTARITHATPAAAYAHSADRYWEGDVNTKDITGGCRDIAQQLVDDNKDIRVLFGGGRRYFLPNTTVDPETQTINSNQRQDGRNLIEEWQNDKKDRGLKYKYVWNKEQFDSIDPYYTDYVLGLFEPNHMQYELDRDRSSKGEPSLAEMTRKAIHMLQKDHIGYFLLVEGARIDHGHHDGLAKKALYETLAMEDALREAISMTDSEETLIIVTADHSHVFDIAGYSYRGTDIFGVVDPVDPTEQTIDGMPYSVLYYGNGPNHKEPRENLSTVDMHNKDFAFPAGVELPWETHGGEDVAIYAEGPMSHLFYGVQEQNYIAHVMAYSMCVGPYFGNCDRPDEDDCVSSANPVSMMTSYCLLAFMSIVKIVL